MFIMLNAVNFSSFVFALPQRDKLGRRVIFYRLNVWDPKGNIAHDIIRCNGVGKNIIPHN